jgi:hypothetical protein
MKFIINEKQEKVLKNSVDLEEKTKLEQITHKYIETFMDTSELSDNFYGITVDIYNTDYGKYCEITGLFKDVFNGTDSDEIYNELRHAIIRVQEYLLPFKFSNISHGNATIDSYLNKYKPYYDSKKKKLTRK